MQILQAGSLPQVKHPKDLKLLEIKRSMNKEWEYLEMFKDRHERIRKSNGESQKEVNAPTRYFNSQEP